MVQDEATRTENFEKLLDDFKKLPGRIERPQTFMEIAGYPHYENVCSNILAFFMDPEESHGLGTLVLDALVSAGNIAAADEEVNSNISVEREVSTSAGNRIDILIESDTQAVLVENKIYASVNNPFDDYSAYLDQIADGRTKHKLLLTLDPTSEGSKWDFENLTYEEFVEQIRSLLGHHVSGADTRHLTMFLDFLNTLENLQKGSRMDSRFVNLLAEQHEDAENFLVEIEAFRKDLRKKVRELRSLINIEKYISIKQSFDRPTTSLYADLIHDVPVSESLTVRIETSIFAQGWEIWIWPENGSYSDLKNLLQRLEIPFEEYREDNGFYHQDNFVHKYSENLDGIRALLQGLIDKLAEYREA